MSDFDFYECPECGFSSVQKSDFKGSLFCPLCAGDTGYTNEMDRRPAKDDDKPEGFDARRGAPPMTTLDLDRLTRLCEATTRGPWQKHGDTIALFNSRGPTKTIAERCYGEDAAFIAAARTAMPALIARVRELEAALQAERARSAALVEALKPFVGKAAYYKHSPAADDYMYCEDLKVGDLRRAARALAAAEGGGDA